MQPKEMKQQAQNPLDGATEEQMQVLATVKESLGERFISAGLANISKALVIRYKTRGGHFARAVYSPRGEWTASHFYRDYDYELDALYHYITSKYPHK